LASYVRRRALRILPAYWVALTIIAFVLQAPGFVEPHSVVSHYLLLHIYDSTQLVGGPIQQAWSLATEVAFYVFVPMWAWTMARPWWRRWSQLRVEMAGLAVLFVGSTLANLALVAIGISDTRFAQLGTWLPFRIGDFVPGMALAVASAYIAQHGLRWPDWTRRAAFALACWAGGLVVFWYVSTQLGLPMFPTFTPSQAFAVRMLYVVIATLFLIPAVLHRGERGLVPALLSNPVAVWLGLVSYGIYIWHEAWQDIYLRMTGQPALAASFRGMLVFTVGASLISAAASWYVVEKPAMRLAARAPGTPLRPSAPDTAASSSTSR
jgi:peptidoglycan/LPS O-acetylase OafA/YrhL